MRFWKSRGSSHCGKWIETATFGLVLLRVVLVDLTSFIDVQEIRSSLQKIDGVEKVTPLEEAPGVITWEVQSEMEAGPIIERLQGTFGSKYSIRQKTLTTGTTEVELTRGQ